MYKLVPTVVLVIAVWVCSGSCELSDILKLCRDGSCDITQAQLNAINRTELNLKLYKFMSAGLPQIFWDTVRESRLQFSDSRTQSHLVANVSTKCRDSLYKVSTGLDQAEVWAYKSKCALNVSNFCTNNEHLCGKVLDASGKTPPSLFKASITSMGDYDQCLDVSTSDFTGMYCMPDLFPPRLKVTVNEWRDARVEHAKEPQVNLAHMSAFKDYAFCFSLCLPSTCTASEVRNLLASGEIPSNCLPLIHWTNLNN